MLRRDPEEIKTDSFRINMNITIQARGPLLQIGVQGPASDLLLLNLPALSNWQQQQSAALLSYPSSSFL